MPRKKPKPSSKASAKSRRSKAAHAPKNKMVAHGFHGLRATTDHSTVFKEVPESHEEAALVLPDCLDSAAAPAVRDALLALRGRPLVVDASQVRRTGAQSLQVLIAAARTWAADGLHYTVTKPSYELLGTMSLIGLAQEDLQIEGLAS
jgi:anti-anti-sigma regulatory factor